MPTKTEQSDLPAAMFGSHGDNTKIVISVANVIDCFYAPLVARYLAERLRLPVFIMSDFQTANSYKVIEKPKIADIKTVDDIPDFVLERFRLKRLPDKIQMVRDSLLDPGTPGGMRRVTGLNTDEKGQVNYFSTANQRSHQIRNEKVHHVKRCLTEPERFGDEAGDILIIAWGSSRGSLEEAVTRLNEQGLKAGGMHFKIVHPLPEKKMLTDIFSKYKKVVTVELTYGDPLKHPPLMMALRDETLFDVNCIICRATGRPLQPANIANKAKEELQKNYESHPNKVNV